MDIVESYTPDTQALCDDGYVGFLDFWTQGTSDVRFFGCVYMLVESYAPVTQALCDVGYVGFLDL